MKRAVFPLVLGLVLGGRVESYPNCPTQNPYGEVYYGDDNFGNNWSPGYYGNAATRLAKPCDSARSNPRGRYTAHMAPCTFQFHKISKEEDASLGNFELSTACSDGTLVGDGGKESLTNTVFEYVKGWKDECVGDFRRCYSIPRDEGIFLDFLCRNKWEVPKGTTHISLNCTEDKQIKREKIDEFNTEKDNKEEKENERYYEKMDQEEAKNERYYDHEMSKLREMEVILVGILVIVLLSSFSCCALTHRWLVLPYKQSLRLQMMDRRTMMHKKRDVAVIDDLEDPTESSDFLG